MQQSIFPPKRPEFITEADEQKPVRTKAKPTKDVERDSAAVCISRQKLEYTIYEL